MTTTTPTTTTSNAADSVLPSGVFSCAGPRVWELRLLVDDERSPRRRVRICSLSAVISSAIAEAIADQLGVDVAHGGDVNNSYGYPARTDACGACALSLGNTIVALAAATDIPANKVTYAGVAAATIGGREIWDRRYSQQSAADAYDKLAVRLRELAEAENVEHLRITTREALDDWAPAGDDDRLRFAADVLEVVDADERGVLIRPLSVEGETSAAQVVVIDASTGLRHHITVPPSCRTVQEGLAWSFGLRPSEYRPTIET